MPSSTSSSPKDFCCCCDPKDDTYLVPVIKSHLGTELSADFCCFCREHSPGRASFQGKKHSQIIFKFLTHPTCTPRVCVFLILIHRVPSRFPTPHHSTAGHCLDHMEQEASLGRHMAALQSWSFLPTSENGRAPHVGPENSALLQLWEQKGCWSWHRWCLLFGGPSCGVGELGRGVDQ